LDESHNATASKPDDWTHALSKALIKGDFTEALGEEYREWLGQPGSVTAINQANICQYVFEVQCVSPYVLLPLPPIARFHSDKENGYTNADVVHEVVSALCRMWLLPPYDTEKAPVNPNPDMRERLLTYLERLGNERMQQAINRIIVHYGHKSI